MRIPDTADACESGACIKEINVDLQAAINRFLDETNDNPCPFAWTADPDKIVAAVRRGHQVLASIH